MTAAVPLPVWPWPIEPERLELLKQAKASLDLDFLIVPVEAAIGMESRVLAFGGRPPFLCRYAPIRSENVGNVASIAAAMRFVLGEQEGWHPDQRWDEAAWLSDVMRCDVVHTHDEDETGRVAFR